MLESTIMKGNEVVIIDYGVGNLLSVRRSLEYIDAKVIVTDDPDVIVRASRIVLPGVGAFGNAMDALSRREIIPAIQEVIQRGSPFLGICLGMQLLFDASEEFGFNKGLSIIPGVVKPLPITTLDGIKLKVPHIGWSQIHPPNEEKPWTGTCLNDINTNDFLYFVHSYGAAPQFEEHKLAECNYGGYKLVAAVQKGNVTGCQFHPEKSGSTGLKILRSFCDSR
jgi:glutamine amidotransferase